MPDSGDSPYRAVVFDLDDTLVPWQTLSHWQWAWKPRGPLLSERHARAALRRSLHEWDRRRWSAVVEKAPPPDGAAYQDHLRRTLKEIAGHALPPAETDAVVARFLRPAGEIETFPDVAPTLAELRSRGLRVACLSSLPSPEVSQYALHRVGLPEEMLLAEPTELTTPPLPTPAGFRSAVKNLGLTVREVLFVGDLFWSDVRAGARAGLDTLLIDRADAWPRVVGRRLRTLKELGAALDASPEPAASAELPDAGPAPDSGAGRA